MIKKKIFAGLTGAAMMISMLSALPAAAAEEEKAYTEGTLPACVFSALNTQQLACRYYEDLPSIPYIRFSDYCRCISGGKELKVTNLSDGNYDLSWNNTAFATVDTENDELTSADLGAFVSFVANPEKQKNCFAYEAEHKP